MDTKNGKESIGAFRLTMFAVLLFVVYPLSVGPAIWLCAHVLPRWTYRPIGYLYVPAMFATRRFEVGDDDLWNWYIHKWVTYDQVYMLDHEDDT